METSLCNQAGLLARQDVGFGINQEFETVSSFQSTSQPVRMHCVFSFSVSTRHCGLSLLVSINTLMTRGPKGPFGRGRIPCKPLFSLCSRCPSTSPSLLCYILPVFPLPLRGHSTLLRITQAAHKHNDIYDDCVG